MQPAPHPSDRRSIEVQELQRSSQSSVDAAAHSLSGPCQRRPWGLNWRSSPWFITLVVGVGIATDLCAYSIVVPVLPFRLEALGYPKEELSSLTSYLLISYSAGLVVFTPPIAYVTRRLNRGLRAPLLGGLVALIASQILFMLVRPYWAMCLARVIQGASSAVVWILGLVLICENVPQEIVGQQLGFALAGTSIGMVIGPPIGGVLYDRLGWNAPIIFGICIAGFDLVGRILIIESKEANIWVPTATDVDVPDKGAVVDSKAAASAPIHEKEGMSIPDSAVSQNQQVQLTTIELMMALFGSARGLTIHGLTFIYGLLYASQEPTLTLHLADVWHKDSLGVGLIYIAAIVPTFIASPAGGWFSDRFGPEFTVAPVLLLSVPWYLLQILEKSLAGFIVLLAISSFLLAAVIAPVSADLASLAQKTPGVGYVHVYSSFNIAFAVASTVGPLIGGQIYDHVKRGWLALCIFWAVLNLVSVIPSVMYMGDRPLITRLRGRRGEKSDAVSSSADDERGGDPPRVEEAAAPGTEESTKKESSKLQS